MKHNGRKSSGQVFTPDYIVCNILDYCGYRGAHVIGRHIIDNSCGNGAFLCEIVRRYCEACAADGTSADGTRAGLERYIHGMDSDAEAVNACIGNLNRTAERFGVLGVDWDVRNENALKTTEYSGKMDFVVGNPPYVRVHNLEESYDDVKRFSFGCGGMTDLYLAFYEVGFGMLASGGKLCYITPSSWLNSVAAANMRKYIVAQKNLVSLVDLGHFQPFDKVSTYTLIALFAKGGGADEIEYYAYDERTRDRKFVSRLSYADIYIDGCFYLSERDALRSLHDIMSRHAECRARVKNGFATLADDVFINDAIPDSPFTITAFKASNGKSHKCFFPYDVNGKPIAETVLFSHAGIAEYMESRRDEILKGRRAAPGWYLYGRSQALSDVNKRKIAMNTIVKDKSSIRIREVPAGCGIYSGLYILTDESVETITSILVSDEFMEYVSSLKKYKSGGYYTFGSKDVEKYINYKLAHENERRKRIA